MRLVLLALLDGALVPVEVLHRGEALHLLLHQVAVGHGVPDRRPPGGPSRAGCRATARVVWLLPAPVRTAQTETTGTFAFSMLAFGPDQPEVGAAASTSEALCITVSCETSL